MNGLRSCLSIRHTPSESVTERPIGSTRSFGDAAMSMVKTSSCGETGEMDIRIKRSSLACPQLPPDHLRPGSLAPNIGDHGPSDSALAAASGWRRRRPAADRHAARCASRDLCSGARPSAPCALDGEIQNTVSWASYLFSISPFPPLQGTKAHYRGLPMQKPLHQLLPVKPRH